MICNIILDANGLSHGTITDDSDVWVFGGQKVYKNFFNQSKHCEQFMASDIAKHFGLEIFNMAPKSTTKRVFSLLKD